MSMSELLPSRNQYKRFPERVERDEWLPGSYIIQPDAHAGAILKRRTSEDGSTLRVWSGTEGYPTRSDERRTSPPLGPDIDPEIFAMGHEAVGATP